MSLSIGIVGLPNVGKSTLFNALTDNNILAANYPFATIEPNTGTVPIPDPRLGKLAELYKTDRVVPATVTFVDIAGLVSGASHGEGLGNQFLSHIRSCHAIAHVVRTFSDTNVVHVAEVPDPKKDIQTVNTELVLADLHTLQTRLPRLEKETRANPKLQPMLESYKKVGQVLNEGRLAHEADVDEAHIADLHLITTKPVMYIFNVDEATLENEAKRIELSSLVAPSNALFLCAKLESELRGLDDTEAKELLASYGQKESGLIQLIHTAYDMLGLQSFLTAGPKEIRAWTIAKGSTAPQAAGVIHTDFERGFIAAEVVSYQDLLVAGSVGAAKSAGKVRTEGKNYVLKPDDIVEFRFNV